MKRILTITLVATILLGSSGTHMTAYASSNDESVSNVEKVTLDKEVLGVKYAPSVGYYLEKETSQGLEFIILGEDVENVELSKSMTRATPAGDFYNPAEPIKKMSGNNVLRGYWWGGFIDMPQAQGGSVASSTKAITVNTQSKASVKPGLTAGWESTDWKDTNELASISRTVGLAGNEAKWDLRDKP